MAVPRVSAWLADLRSRKKARRCAVLGPTVGSRANSSISRVTARGSASRHSLAEAGIFRPPVSPPSLLLASSCDCSIASFTATMIMSASNSASSGSTAEGSMSSETMRWSRGNHHNCAPARRSLDGHRLQLVLNLSICF